MPRDSHSRNQQRPRVGRRCFCVCVLSGEGELASRESISKVEGPDETHSPRLEYSIVVSSMTKRTERRVHLSFIIFGFSDRRILLSFGLDILQSSRVGSNSIVYGQKRAREREGGREGGENSRHTRGISREIHIYVCMCTFFRFKKMWSPWTLRRLLSQWLYHQPQLCSSCPGTLCSCSMLQQGMP